MPRRRTVGGSREPSRLGATLALVLMLAAGAAPCFAQETGKVSVGVLELWGEQDNRPTWLYGLFDGKENYKAERFLSFPSEELENLDVLVVFQPKRDEGMNDDERKALVDWVNQGHGLLAVFAAAGEGDAALIPDVASVSGYPCDVKDDYELEEGVVAGTCSLTKGYDPGYRYMLLASDYAALTPGEEGNTVLRSVVRKDDKALSSLPLMVAGNVGKGKYGAYGAQCGSRLPLGVERAMFLETIDWLAGDEEDVAVSGDIGEGADLGPAHIDFAVNGNAEKEPVSGETPPGWELTGKGAQFVQVAVDTNSHSGKYSVCYQVPALHPDDVASELGKLPSVYNGSWRGPDEKDLHAMAPNSKYTVSFWLKGDPGNKTRPQLWMSFFTWVEGANGRKGIPYQKTVPVTDEWVHHEMEYFPRLGQVGKGCYVEFKLIPGQADDFHPLSTMYMDELSIAREYSGVPKGVSFESVLAGCEEHIEPEWKDAMSQDPLDLKRIPAGTPFEFDQAQLDRPMYDPLPDGWKEFDISGEWKIMKLPETWSNPTNDRGTVEGFWKVDLDDSEWPVRTVPSHWHNEDKPDPEGELGWGSRYRSNATNNFEAVGWYRHRFSVPADFKGERIMLVFKGYDHEATVFLNGEEIGKDVGFYCPVEFDITDLVKTGEENMLAVRLFDRRGTGYVDGRMALGGLFNRVTLQARPDTFVSRALINPRLEKECCEIDLSITNSTPDKKEIQLTAEVAPDPNQKGCVKGDAKPFTVDLGKKTLEPGLNEFEVVVPMKDAVRWSWENPFLYILNFKAGDEVLGKERFGFREFRQEGRGFYLNNERIYLVGGPAPVFGGVTAIELENRKNLIRKAIMARKQANNTCFIPRASMQASYRQMYDICDELGILLYDWPGAPGFIPKERWFYWRYNHPSEVMYAFGNEARQQPSLLGLNRAYKWAKKHDKQNRPVSTTTGGMPKLIAPDTDVVDIHLYPGDINGHPLDMGAYIRGYTWDTWKYHGKNIPLIAYENGGNYTCPVVDRVEMGRALLKYEPVEYRRRLRKMIRGQMEDYHMPIGMRWLALYGMRRYCVDDYDRALEHGIDPSQYWHEMAFYRLEWCVKRVAEQSRRAGDLFQGFGHNWQVMNTVAWVSEGAENNPGGRRNARGWAYEAIDSLLVKSAGFETYYRYWNPTFVCLNVFDKHVFGGGKLKATVYAINDTPRESEPWKVMVEIKDKSGKCLSASVADVGTVPTFKRKLFPYEWDVPSDLATGFYTVELFLVQGDKVISDNYYKFFVMNGNDLADRVDTNGKKVALYDSLVEEDAPEGMTTKKVLDDLKFDYDRIEKFDSLDEYQVLIIGYRSRDKIVKAGAENISEWVKNGGRLLVCEQYVWWGNRDTSVPFFPQLTYRPGNAIVGDIIAWHHPLFDGIRHVDCWEQWNGAINPWGGGQGAVCVTRIGPLNRTMVATACVGTPRSSNEAVQMLISEVREGNGIILFSQPEATRRYGTDPVATRYLQNAFRYIVSDESRYAQSIDGFEVVNVDPHRCGYLDMTMFAELEPDDVSPDLMKKLEGGKEICGGLAFKSAGSMILSAQKAMMELMGEIDFLTGESSKLMHPEWEAEKRKKDTDQRGLMPNRMEVVYILHRAKDMSEREIVGKYKFKYTDGSLAEEEIIGGLNIAPEGKDSDLSGGKYVGDGFYICRWVNPTPEKAIKSVSVEMESDTAELQIGGITTYLIREKVHD